jgi:hypothetical protein
VGCVSGPSKKKIDSEGNWRKESGREKKRESKEDGEEIGKGVGEERGAGSGRKVEQN